MPMARISDPETSHEAAESVRYISITQHNILSLFHKFGKLSDEQLQKHYGELVARGNARQVSESGIRSRRAELVRLGKLEDSGLRTQLASGRKAILWAVAK